MSANKNPMDRLIEEIGDVHPGSSLEDALYRVDESYADLLEALRVMVKEFGYDVVHPNGLVHDEHATLQSAIAAIAKAEGA